MSQGAVYETYMFEFTLSEKWSEQSEIKLLWKFQVSSKTGWKRTLHNSQQLKHFFFLFPHILIGEVGIFTSLAAPKDLSVFASNMPWDLCHIFNFILFIFFAVAQNTNIQAGEQTAGQRTTTEWKGRKKRGVGRGAHTCSRSSV